MLFGLVTPFWITLGMGIASPADLVLPQINGIWNVVAQTRLDLLLVSTVLIAVAGIVMAGMNLMTIMNYRMQTRVYNAFFVFVLLMAVVAICIDFSNVAVYLPLLGLMTAVQMAHAHTLSHVPFRYLLILLLIVGSVGFFTANIITL